ncbi:hypothetical protein ABL78_0157 [Leptomonas seymouri]|uniref:Protein FAM184A/B N-terminal domain-containing protein n=1 Tax=Leptomonas seymouri TaxID=5684 RepID=A0A0N1I973_LEPSE|nr:hypothetical protein ABL78_0157 [Leptomonas seymouri]|eukprot:KPI90721.1 hypothetical protein ABL78_0157 [Leptomonas seymouri]
MMAHRPSLTSAQDEDRHYKMCKKIAQLTKVIYTLNNRSEDNEQRTVWLQQAHTTELSRLAQEYERQIEELQKRASALQAEKTNLASSLEAQHREQLQSVQTSFQVRVTDLTEQVTEQLAKFESSLRANKQQMAAELAAEAKRVRECKDTELANLVQEYNDKYKAMLAEQLDSRDALEAELNKKWSAKVQALEAQLAATQGDKDGQLQAKSKLLQETLQKCALLSNEKDTLTLQLETTQTQTRTLQDRLAEIAADLGSERHQRKSTEELNGKLEAQLTGLQRELASLAEQYSESQRALAAANASYSRSTAAQKVLENEKALLSSAKDSAVHGLEECKAILAKCTAERDAARKQLDDLRSSSEAKSSSLSELTGKLTEAQLRIAAFETDLEKEKQRHASEMARAQQRFESAMQKMLEDAREADATHQRELRNAQNSLQSDSASERQKLLEKHKMEMDAMERRHSVQVQQLQSLLSTMKEQHSGLSDELSKATEKTLSLEQRCGELEGQLRDQLQEAAKEKARTAEHVAELLHELESVRSSGLEEVGAQHAALEQLRAEHAAAQAEADAVHAKALEELRERAEERVEAMKAEHAALLLALQKDHASSLQRAKDEAAARSISVTRDADAQLASLQKEFKDKLEAQRTAAAAVEQKLLSTVANLEAQLSDLQRASSEQQTSAASQLQQVQLQLSQLEDTLRETRAKAADELVAVRRDAEAQRQEDAASFEAMRQQQVNAERLRYDAAVAAHREEMEKLEACMKERTISAERRLKSMVIELEAKRASALQELEARLRAAHKTQMQGTMSAHEAERTRLQNALAVAEANLRDQGEHLSNGTQVIDALTVQRDQALMELSTERRNNAAATVAAQNKHAADLEELRVRHERELNKLAAAHKSLVDDYLKQQSETRAEHQAVVDQLQQELVELQHKYDFRESRAEDVELINRLLVDNKDKEMELAKAYADMRLYKLELINREENYNKVFRRNPVVADYSGVAEAITKRDHACLPVISAARKQSTR